MKKSFLKYLAIIFSLNTLYINAQTISPNIINSLGSSFQTNSSGLDINIGEAITGLISNNNQQITQGFLQPNNFTINVKLFLEGFYTGNGLMNNYGAGGCLYKTGNSSNPNNVDTVRLTLAHKITHENIESAFAILQTNGSANFYFHGATEDQYYLKITHRNTIETWSASPVYLSNYGVYDFTIAQNKAYGNNLVSTFDQMGWALYSGDINNTTTNNIGIQDGIVQFSDYSILENALYQTKLGYTVEDITGDGVVESADYVLMENNYYYSIIAMRP